jgi:ribosomal protein S18 acetylase RimI-like enzyme
MEIKVLREAKHLQKINVLIDLLFNGKYEKTVSLERLEEIIKNPNKFLVCVEVDGELAGLCLYSKEVFITRTVLQYDDLCVDTKFRGMGIGTAIDKFGFELAKELDCDCIELVVPTTSVPVQRQHLKNGYTFRTQLPMGVIFKTWKTK